MLHEHKAAHQKGSHQLGRGVFQNAHIVLSSPVELADKFLRTGSGTAPAFWRPVLTAVAGV